MFPKEDSNLIFKQCERNREIKPENLSISNAALFLKLRQNGCDQKKALIFSKKKFCRYDKTRKFDGPSTHRILRPSQTENEKYNTYKGWNLLGNANFSLDKEFVGHENLLLTDQDDEFIDQNIQKLQVQDPETYAFQINSIKSYLEQVHKNVKSHHEIEKKDRPKWAKSLNKAVGEELKGQRYYIDYKSKNKDESVKFYELVKDLDQELTDNSELNNHSNNNNNLSSTTLQQSRLITPKKVKKPTQNQNILDKLKVFPRLIDNEIKTQIKIEKQPNDMTSSRFGFQTQKSAQEIKKERKMRYFCVMEDSDLKDYSLQSSNPNHSIEKPITPKAKKQVIPNQPKSSFLKVFSNINRSESKIQIENQQEEKEQEEKEQEEQKSANSLLSPIMTQTNFLETLDSEKKGAISMNTLNTISSGRRSNKYNPRASTFRFRSTGNLLETDFNSNLKVVKLGGHLGKYRPTGVEEYDQFSTQLDDWIKNKYTASSKIASKTRSNMSKNISRYLEKQNKELELIKKRTLEQPKTKTERLECQQKARELYQLKNLKKIKYSKQNNNNKGHNNSTMNLVNQNNNFVLDQIQLEKSQQLPDVVTQQNKKQSQPSLFKKAKNKKVSFMSKPVLLQSNKNFKQP